LEEDTMALGDFQAERVERARDTYLIADVRLRYSTKTKTWFLECNGAQGSGAFRRNLTDERTVEFIRALMERITLSEDRA
jgi:hypothetical protein